MEFIRPVYSLKDDCDYIDFAIHHVSLFCKSEDLEVLSWLYDVFKKNNMKMKIMLERHFIYYGMIELIKSKNINIPHVIDNVHSKASIHFFEYIYDKTTLGYDCVLKLIRKERLDVISLYKHKIEIDENFVNNVCRYGHKDILDWLRNEKIIAHVNDKQLYKLLKKGHIDLFLEYHDPSLHIWSEKMFKYIAYYNVSSAALHITREFPEVCEKLILFITACGHLELLQEILNNYPDKYIKDPDQLIHYACSSENSQIIKLCYDYLKRNNREWSGVIKEVTYDSNGQLLNIYLIPKYGISDTHKLSYINNHVNKTLEDIVRIETYEQRSPEWLNERKFIITSTNVAAIADHDKYNNFDQFLKEKLWPKFKGNDATMYGNSLEIFAYDLTYIALCKEYVGKKNAMMVTLRDPGLILWDKHPWIGASSDGIVDVYYNDNYKYKLTIELKSPYYDDNFYKEIPHHYYDQIMTAMQTTNTDECKFVVYLHNRIQYNTFHFNPVYWKTEIMPKLYERYFDDVLTSMILKNEGKLYEGTIKPAIVFDYI